MDETKRREEPSVCETPAHDAKQPIPPKEPYSAYTPNRQLFIVLIATFAGFFAPLCGAVYLPSLIVFQDVFHTTGTVINATVSVYMAFFAVTPLFGAAASDYGGRKTVYLSSLAIFLVANTLLAAVPATIGGLFVLRIFQAVGASVVTSVGAGTVADVTEPSRRASRMGLFLLGPNLGPVLGPLIGGQFSSPARWRWIFGFLCKALAQKPGIDSCLLISGSYRLFPSLCNHHIISPRNAPMHCGKRKSLRKFIPMAGQASPAAKTARARGRIPEAAPAHTEEHVPSPLLRPQRDRQRRLRIAILGPVLHLHRLSARVAKTIRMERERDRVRISSTGRIPPHFLASRRAAIGPPLPSVQGATS